MCMVYENVYINGIKKSSPHPFEFSVILLKIKQKKSVHTRRYYSYHDQISREENINYESVMTSSILLSTQYLPLQ